MSAAAMDETFGHLMPIRPRPTSPENTTFIVFTMGWNQWNLIGILFVCILRVNSPNWAPPYDSEATEVTWSSKNLIEIPKELQIIINVRNLDLSNNELQAVEADVFENLTRLEEVNFSGNANLIVPENGCFLISESIKLLNVSYIASIGVINHSTLSCLPNLTDLIFILNRNCKKTRMLFEGTDIKVSCKRGEKTQFKRKDSNGTLPAITKDITPTLPEVTTAVWNDSTTGNPSTNSFSSWLAIILGFVVVAFVICLFYIYLAHKRDIIDNKENQSDTAPLTGAVGSNAVADRSTDLPLATAPLHH